MNTTQLPITYRDYTIKRGEYTKFEFVHNEYDGPEDNRLGTGNSIEDCKEQIDEKYDDSLFKAAAELTRPVEEEPKSSLYNLMDHSSDMLLYLMLAVDYEINSIEPIKASLKNYYSCLTAWKKLILSAREKKAKMNEMAA